MGANVISRLPYKPEFYATGSSSERFLRGGGSTNVEVEWIQ